MRVGWFHGSCEALAWFLFGSHVVDVEQGDLAVFVDGLHLPDDVVGVACCFPVGSVIHGWFSFSWVAAYAAVILNYYIN